MCKDLIYILEIITQWLGQKPTTQIEIIVCTPKQRVGRGEELIWAHDHSFELYPRYISWLSGAASFRAWGTQFLPCSSIVAVHTKKLMTSLLIIHTSYVPILLHVSCSHHGTLKSPNSNRQFAVSVIILYYLWLYYTCGQLVTC